jgi:hypothetical protein
MYSRVYKKEFNRTPAPTLFSLSLTHTHIYIDESGVQKPGFIKFILLSEMCSSKDREICWCSLYVWGRMEMDEVFCCRSLKDKDHLENMDCDGEIIVKLISIKCMG